MADSKVTEIEKKKKELETELTRIQHDLDKSFDEVKEDVSSSLDPKAIIRKHPLPALGASVVLGFLLGSGKRGKGSDKNRSSGGLGSVLGHEVKKALMKRGVSLLFSYLDDKVEELKEHSE
ncbi:MAG: hypothetical protein FH748_08515 [Balneolaceae bacterium]|nr:hypothetical protein [Balneolaceae bacterium]